MNESLCPVRLKTFTTQMYDEQQENSTQYILITKYQVQKYKRLWVWASDFNTFVYMPRPPFQSSHFTLLELFATFPLHWKLLATLYIVGKIVGFKHPLVELFATLLYIENCWLHCTLLAKLLASSIPCWAVSLYIENCWQRFACTCTTPTNSMYLAKISVAYV